MISTRRGLVALSLVVSACGPSNAGFIPAQPGAKADTTHTDHVPAGTKSTPALSEIAIDLPTLQVPVGESMLCTYITLPNDDRVGLRSWKVEVEGQQHGHGHHGDDGVGVHHMLGFLTTETHEEAPDGTTFDCTTTPWKKEWDSVLFPIVNIDDEALPDGLAVYLPSRARLVIQAHLHNDGAEPAPLRTQLRAEPAEAKATPAAPWLTATREFRLQPGVETTVSYECIVEQDMNLYMLDGHMHDLGRSLTIEIGPPNALEVVLERPEWKGNHVEPPIGWPLDAPFSVRKGDIIRNTCTWANTTDLTVEFPNEMCATFGFFFPAPNGAERCTASALTTTTRDLD